MEWLSRYFFYGNILKGPFQNLVLAATTLESELFYFFFPKKKCEVICQVNLDCEPDRWFQNQTGTIKLPGQLRSHAFRAPEPVIWGSWSKLQTPFKFQVRYNHILGSSSNSVRTIVQAQLSPIDKS